MLKTFHFFLFAMKSSDFFMLFFSSGL